MSKYSSTRLGHFLKVSVRVDCFKMWFSAPIFVFYTFFDALHDLASLGAFTNWGQSAQKMLIAMRRLFSGLRRYRGLDLVDVAADKNVKVKIGLR